MRFPLVGKHLRRGAWTCCARVARPPTRGYRTVPTATSRDEPSKLTEDDYRFYLRMRVKTPPFEPGAYLKRLNPRALVSQLPTNLAADPLRAFEHSSTSLTTACNALELYVGRIHIYSQKEAREKDRLTYEREQPGRRALLWLLSSDTSEEVDFKLGVRLAQIMTHYLVAEKEIETLRT